jgi:hypothetical protein
MPPILPKGERKMIKTFVLNGTTYPQKEMDYNMMCDLEDMGISMGDMQNKSMSFIRAYVSMCMGSDVKRAGREIENHITSGGSMDTLMDAIKGAIEDSGFFQALSKTANEEATTSEETKKK